MKVALLLLLVLPLDASAKKDSKEPARVIFPGGGACKSKWAQELQAQYAVRFQYEFYDHTGKYVMPAPPGHSSQHFCSASVVRVGSKRRLKIVSAGHCIKDHFRKPASAAAAAPPELQAASPQMGNPPLSAYNVSLMARVGGRDPGIPIKFGLGPVRGQSSGDSPEEYFRKNDFVIADSDAGVLEDLFKDKAVPELCPPTMKQSDIAGSVVIGFGLTNNGQSSKTPLCGDQPIATMEGGIIAAPPHPENQSGACPGDSGGGLWALPKGGGRPCLMGVVSGPRTRSTNGIEPSLKQCMQAGVEAVFASVFQQSELVEEFVNGRETSTGGRPPR